MGRFSIVGSGLLALTLLLISPGSAAPPPIRVDVPATTIVSATSVTFYVYVITGHGL